MRHLKEFEKWAKSKYQSTPLSFSEVGLMKDAFDEAWEQGRKHSKSLDFVIQYLYSEHQICSPTDEAAPYTPEELKKIAQAILRRR